MFNIAILLFALAAVFGLWMAVMHFRCQTPPRPVLATFHGLFAASALLVLLLAVIRSHTTGAPVIALGLLVLAALGGFGLLTFHLKHRALPSSLVVGHGLFAVTGFIVLLSALLFLRS